MEKLIEELKEFIKKEGFIYETGSWINDCVIDDDKVIYIEDVLDKIEELEKKYLINS